MTLILFRIFINELISESWEDSNIQIDLSLIKMNHVIEIMICECLRL